MTTAEAPPAEAAPQGRLMLGGGVFIVGQLSPLCIPLVTSSGFSAGTKTALSGLLLLGVPELAIFLAIAILGSLFVLLPVVLLYLVEPHDDGHATVMIPQTPTAMTGRIRIVDQDRIEPLDASLADVTAVLGHWGLGTRDLLANSLENDGGGQGEAIPGRNKI